MPAPSPTAQADGLSIVTRGMHSGVAPRLVAQQQVAMAINVTFRNGLPRTRPVWQKKALTYADLLHEATGTTQARATQALFQDAGFYQGFGNNESCLVALIGGRLFKYTVGSTYQVQDISVQTWDAGVGAYVTDLNSSGNPDAWMWQAEDFLIVNNGQAYPLFFDGAKTVRSMGPPGEELGVGRMGAYVQGRVWQSNADGQSFMAGDLVYSHGFNDGYNGRRAVLKTTENTFLSGGGAFAVPVSAGQITAMGSVAIADTSLGQGPLQVSTASSIFSVSVPLLREAWATTNYPLMTIGLPDYGSMNAGWATVNGDLWYRSRDGIRSYQVGRRDQETWVHTPLSVEVEKILNWDTEELLAKGCCTLFNNRLLVTVSPYAVMVTVNGEQMLRGTAHRGIIALDFNNISNLTTRSQPAYDGLWTGLNVLKVVRGVFNGVERLFAFALDANNAICLYELLWDDAGYFDDRGDALVEVESVIETRAMGWRDNGNLLKKLLCGDLYLDRVVGNDTVAFDFRFRSDEDPAWTAWKTFSVCAPLRNCVIDCTDYQPAREQYRTYLRLVDPPDTMSALTHRMKRTGYEFQVRMAVTGFFQLNRAHFWADVKSDSVVTAGPGAETCTLLTGCDLPWFDYQIEV